MKLIIYLFSFSIILLPSSISSAMTSTHWPFPTHGNVPPISKGGVQKDCSTAKEITKTYNAYQLKMSELSAIWSEAYDKKCSSYVDFLDEIESSDIDSEDLCLFHAQLRAKETFLINLRQFCFKDT